MVSGGVLDRVVTMNWFENTFEISHSKHNAIISMEGIRGFAVSLVFIVHYVTLIWPWLEAETSTRRIAEYIHSIGNTGVDLFFVLSGYLIYGMLITKDTPFIKYMLRRIKRIYPTFSVVFFVYIALSFVFVSETKIPRGTFEAVVYIIQNYLLMPGLFDIQPIITVAWSLSYEFFYYISMPVFLFIFKVRYWSAKYRFWFFLLGSACLFYSFGDNSRYVRLLMFVPGILIFEAVTNSFFKYVPPVGLFALLAAIAMVVVFKAFQVQGIWKFVGLYVLFFLFCLDCFAGKGLASRLFSATYVRWLGNMSYSYYLVHGLALKAIFMAIGHLIPVDVSGTLLFWVLILPCFFLTLIPAIVLFVLVERPYSLQRF